MLYGGHFPANHLVLQPMTRALVLSMLFHKCYIRPGYMFAASVTRGRQYSNIAILVIFNECRNKSLLR